MASIICCRKGIGWKHIQLHKVFKLQKTWEYDNKEYRVDAYFGRMCNGSFTPTVIMNVYEQGAGTKCVVDDNCDVWKNMFTSTTQEDGNAFYKYLKKHGFQPVPLSRVEIVTDDRS